MYLGLGFALAIVCNALLAAASSDCLSWRQRYKRKLNRIGEWFWNHRHTAAVDLRGAVT